MGHIISKENMSANSFSGKTKIKKTVGKLKGGKTPQRLCHTARQGQKQLHKI